MIYCIPAIRQYIITYEQTMLPLKLGDVTFKGGPETRHYYALDYDMALSTIQRLCRHASVTKSSITLAEEWI